MVRRISVLVLLIMNLTMLSLATEISNDELFISGVEAYNNQSYQEALEHFQAIVDNGIRTPELYHNIGNSFYRLNKTGKAILNYKRGLRLEPNNQFLKANLEYLLSITKDRQLIREDNPFLLITDKILYSLTLNTLLIFTLILFVLTISIINLIIIYYKNKDKTLPFFVLSLCLILFFTFSYLSFHRWQHLNDDREAVLTASATSGYSGPSDDFTHLFRINEGMVFIVENRIDDWSQIRLSNGLRGWIQNDTYELVLN